MSSSLIIDLNHGQDRLEAENFGTLCGRATVVTPAPDFRDVFVANYASIRAVVSHARHRGVVVIAIQRARVAGTATLASRMDKVRALTVGRHGQVDMYLDDDDELSLRHLMVMTLADAGRDDVRFRLLDLRSGAAIVGEDGLRLEALEAEGPVFVLVGRTVLMVFPVTGDEPRWPEDAGDGWACVPERVYFNARAPQASRPVLVSTSVPASPGLTDSVSQTLVERLSSPISDVRQLVSDDEVPVGHLVLDHARGRTHLSVGPSALRRGVLLGRYRRCDSAGLPALRHQAISRVHLLIVELDGQLHAIDAGSTNGVYSGSRRVRHCSLPPARELTLCDAVRLHWAPLH